MFSNSLKICFCISILVSSFAIGQETITFENFNTKNGLISNEVNRIAEDKNGYIWLGTTEGVSRFDGYQFTNFRLSKTRVTCAIAVDETGGIWAANDEAIYQYNSLSQCFDKYISIASKPVYNLPAQSISKSANTVSLLSYKGILWFANNDGLYRIANHQVKITSLTNYGSHTILKLLNNDTLLLATPKGVYLYSIRNDQYRVITEIKNAQSVFLDKKGQTWWGEEGKLCSINLAGKLHRWTIKLPKSILGGFGIVTFIEQSPIKDKKDSTLWVGSYGQGVFIFDLKSAQFIGRISTQFGVKKALSSNQVSKLMVDKNQNVWIASNNGIDKYDPHQLQFKVEDFRFFYEKGIERLRQIIAHPTHPNLCWVFTSNYGFFLYDKREKKVIKEFLNYNSDVQRKNNIYEVKLEGDRALWVSLPNAVLRVDLMTYQTKMIQLPSSIKISASIDWDGDHTLAIFKTNGQLFFLNTITLLIKELKSVVWQSKGYNFENIFDVVWDKYRKKWWFTTDKGVFSCVASKDTIYQENNVFAEKIIIGIEKDIWFTGEENTLYKFNPETKKTERYSPNFNKNNFRPQGLFMDKNGVIWMNTFKGLYSFEPKKKIFQVFGENEGLSNDLSYGFLYDDGTGIIYLNHNDGYTSFDPLQKSMPRPIVKPQITAIRLNDSLQIAKTPQLSIRNQGKTLTFEYTHLDYTQSAKTVFYFQLEGFEKEWKFNGTGRKVSYNNLANGSYVFWVYAINSAGKKSHVAHSIKIVIWQPFWEQPWFWWLASFTILSLAVWGILIYRYQQRLRLLQLRDNIARDLHDDMGSYLSSIQIQSQNASSVLIENPELAQNMLQEIGQNARQVTGALRDVVWAINPDNDSFGKLIRRMQEIGTGLLDNHGLVLHFQVERGVVQLTPSMSQRKELLMIFKEALTNIVKHAQAQQVWVTITHQDRNIYLSIRDDGQGFDMNTPKNGNGLRNFQKRAKNMGGKITILSEIDKGTTLSLTFPSHHRGIVG